MQYYPTVELLFLVPNSTEEQIQKAVTWIQNSLMKNKSISIIAKSQPDISGVVAKAVKNRKNQNPQRHKILAIFREIETMINHEQILQKLIECQKIYDSDDSYEDPLLLVDIYFMLIRSYQATKRQNEFNHLQQHILGMEFDQEIKEVYKEQLEALQNANINTKIPRYEVIEHNQIESEILKMIQKAKEDPSNSVEILVNAISNYEENFDETEIKIKETLYLELLLAYQIRGGKEQEFEQLREKAYNSNLPQNIKEKIKELKYNDISFIEQDPVKNNIINKIKESQQINKEDMEKAANLLKECQDIYESEGINDVKLKIIINMETISLYQKLNYEIESLCEETIQLQEQATQKVQEKYDQKFKVVKITYIKLLQTKAQRIVKDNEDYEEGIRVLSVALQINQKMVDQNKSLVQIQFLMGKYSQIVKKNEDAFSHWKAAFDNIEGIQNQEDYQNEKKLLAYNIGQLEYEQKNIKETQKYWIMAVQIMEQQKQPNDLQQLQSLTNQLGNLFYQQGDVEQSILYFEKTLKLSIEIFGHEHIQVANKYNNLGEAYRQNKQFDKAVEYFLKSIELKKKENQQNKTLGNSYNNLALTLQSMKKWDEAITNFQEALKIYEINSLNSANSLFGLGECYRQKRELDGAARYFQDSYDIKKKELTLKNKSTQHCAVQLASVLFQSGQLEQSLKIFNEILDIQKQLFIDFRGRALDCCINLKQYCICSTLTESISRSFNIGQQSSRHILKSDAQRRWSYLEGFIEQKKNRELDEQQVIQITYQLYKIMIFFVCIIIIQMILAQYDPILTKLDDIYLSTIKEFITRSTETKPEDVAQIDIKFPVPYTEIPQVGAWFYMLGAQVSNGVTVNVAENSITKSGFTLEINYKRREKDFLSVIYIWASTSNPDIQFRKLSLEYMKDGFKWLYFDKTYIEPPVVVPFIRGYLCQNDFYSSRCLFKVYTKYVNTTAASIGILDESTQTSLNQSVTVIIVDQRSGQQGVFNAIDSGYVFRNAYEDSLNMIPYVTQPLKYYPQNPADFQLIIGPCFLKANTYMKIYKDQKESFNSKVYNQADKTVSWAANYDVSVRNFTYVSIMRAHCNIENSYLSNGQCICEKGYLLQEIDGIKQCSRCDLKCFSCENQLDQCTSCVPMLNRIYNSNTNKCDCLVGYHDDNYLIQCKKCHYSCDQCSGLSSFSCLSCFPDWILDQTTNQCKCIDGYLFNEMTKSCECIFIIHSYAHQKSTVIIAAKLVVDLHNINVSHVSTSSQVIVSIIKEYAGASLATTILVQANVQVLSQQQLQCQECSDNCNTCQEFNGQLCTSCDSKLQRVLNNSACICISGYFEKENQCQICHFTCTSCFGETQYECLSCDKVIAKRNLANYQCKCQKGLFDLKIEKECQELCPDGTFIEGDECTDCHKLCKSCSDSTPLSCTSCAQKQLLDVIIYALPKYKFNLGEMIELSSKTDYYVCDESMVAQMDKIDQIFFYEWLVINKETNRTVKTSKLNQLKTNTQSYALETSDLDVNQNYIIRIVIYNKLVQYENSNEIEIKINSLGIAPMIKNGDRQHSFHQKLEIELEIINLDNQEILDTDNFKLEWECQTLSFKPCLDLKNKPLTFNQTQSIQTFENKTLIIFENYQFKVKVYKDSETTTAQEASCLITVIEQNLPSLSLNYDYSTLGNKVNLNEEMYFEFLYPNHSSLVLYYITIYYNYESVQVIQFQHNKVVFRLSDHYTQFNSTIGDKVKLIFSVFNPDYSLPSTTSLNLMINLPAENCKVDVQPKNIKEFDQVQISVQSCFHIDRTYKYKYGFYQSHEDYELSKELKRPMKLYFWSDFITYNYFNVPVPRSNSVKSNKVLIVVLILDAQSGLSEYIQEIDVEPLKFYDYSQLIDRYNKLALGKQAYGQIIIHSFYFQSIEKGQQQYIKFLEDIKKLQNSLQYQDEFALDLKKELNYKILTSSMMDYSKELDTLKSETKEYFTDLDKLITNFDKLVLKQENNWVYFQQQKIDEYYVQVYRQLEFLNRLIELNQINIQSQIDNQVYDQSKEEDFNNKIYQHIHSLSNLIFTQLQVNDPSLTLSFSSMTITIQKTTIDFINEFLIQNYINSTNFQSDSSIYSLKHIKFNNNPLETSNNFTHIGNSSYLQDISIYNLSSMSYITQGMDNFTLIFSFGNFTNSFCYSQMENGNWSNSTCQSIIQLNKIKCICPQIMPLTSINQNNSNETQVNVTSSNTSTHTTNDSNSDDPKKLQWYQAGSFYIPVILTFFFIFTAYYGYLQDIKHNYQTINDSKPNTVQVVPIKEEEIFEDHQVQNFRVSTRQKAGNQNKIVSQQELKVLVRSPNEQPKDEISLKQFFLVNYLYLNSYKYNHLTLSLLLYFNNLIERPIKNFGVFSVQLLTFALIQHYIKSFDFIQLIQIVFSISLGQQMLINFYIKMSKKSKFMKILFISIYGILILLSIAGIAFKFINGIKQDQDINWCWHYSIFIIFDQIFYQPLWALIFYKLFKDHEEGSLNSIETVLVMMCNINAEFD